MVLAAALVTGDVINNNYEQDNKIQRKDQIVLKMKFECLLVISALFVNLKCLKHIFALNKVIKLKNKAFSV